MAAVTPPRQPPRALVGRSRELEQLSHCLEQVRRGQGALVVVDGEAGVGKTALVRQLEDQALTVTGHCYEFSAAPPYGPWLEILDELTLRNAPPREEDRLTRQVIEPSAQDRHEIFTRIFHSLAEVASRQPLVLVLEDMHWADNASVELVAMLCRRIHEQPILIVVTYRDDGLERGKPLQRVLPALLRDDRTQRIHVRRLDAADTIDLLGLRYDLAQPDSARLGEYLQKRAQGNPFFIMELLYALEEQRILWRGDGHWRLRDLDAPGAQPPLPALVRHVIDGRLEQVDDQTRRLLQVAAVLGQEVPIDLWRMLAGVDDDTFAGGAKRAIDAHFMHDNPDARALSFSHALVREAIYLSLVLPERQRLHCLAGEALLRDRVPDVDGIAYHFARAMDPRAVEWLARAGARALSLSAPRAAIEHCDLALELADTLGVEAKIEIFQTRGDAYAMIGGFLRARKDFTTCLEHSRRSKDTRAEWQALQDLGQLWASRNYARTREYFDEALRLARALGDDRLVAHSLNLVGNWYLNDDRPVEAIRFHNEALDFFRRVDDVRAIAQTTDLLGMDHLIRGDVVTAAGYMRNAIDDFEALGDQMGLCSALSTYMITAGTLGFEQEIPARAAMVSIEETMERAYALSREIHWRAGEACIACVIGGYHAVRGRYDLALEWMERGVAIAEEIEHREWTSYGLDGLADIHLALLDRESSRRHAERALQAARLGGSRIHEKGAMATLAGAHLANNDPEAALRILGSPCPPHGSLASVDERADCVWHAQAVLDAGDAEQALDNIQQLIRTALPADTDMVSPWYGRIMGMALVALERYSEAEQVLISARDTAAELEYKPELWRIWVELGKHYAHRHRPRDAGHCFSEAREVIESLARSVPDPQLRDHFLNAALDMIPGARGLSPFQAARLEAGGLTPRQRDVAVLIAQGCSNRAIADSLSISERTVEGHVSAIMHAMDFSSRAQIAAWAVDQGLIQPGSGQ